MPEPYDIPKKLRRMLNLMNRVRPPSETLTLPQIKKLRKPFPFQFMVNWVTGKPVPLPSVKELSFPARDGVNIPIRIYRPSAETNLPIILNYHGGGWVLGNLQQSDSFCRRVAKETGALVISVDYRLAPEHPFPIPLNDCYDALLWAKEQAAEIGGNPEKIAVMGDSAGGNLSAAVCLMAKEQNGPKIVHQCLIYPAVNGKMDYPSIETNAHAPLLTAAAMYFFRDAYEANPGDYLHPYFSPYLAEDLSGLPPALVITAGYDPLYDDGRMYAEKLQQAGNEVRYEAFEKEIHGFISFPNHSLRNREAVDLICKELLRWL